MNLEKKNILSVLGESEVSAHSLNIYKQCSFGFPQTIITFEIKN